MNIFKVVGGQLFHIAKEDINTGSKNFFKVQFVFDNSWEDYNKLRFVEFFQDIDSTHFKVSLNDDGIAPIPTEIICSNLPLYVGVSAENDNGEIIATTNFLPIKVVYGANTQKEDIAYPEIEDNLYELFSPNTKLRYLRIEKGVLEYSSDNKTWYKVSSAISGGGLTEEEVEEIVTEATEDLPKDIDGSANEENFVLTVELKDKNGNVVSAKNIDLSFLKTDLTEYVKFTDYATADKAGVVKIKNSQFGIGYNSAAGAYIQRAEPDTILAKTHQHKPIVPGNLDYAMKVGVTTNAETLTDEEKTSACEWLGAVEKIPDKTNKQTEVYTNDKSNITGRKTCYLDNYQLTTPWAIPTRGQQGHLVVPDIDLTKDIGAMKPEQLAINKNYVDGVYKSTVLFGFFDSSTPYYYVFEQRRKTAPKTALEVLEHYKASDTINEVVKYYLPNGCLMVTESGEVYKHLDYITVKKINGGIVYSLYANRDTFIASYNDDQVNDEGEIVSSHKVQY